MDVYVIAPFFFFLTEKDDEMLKNMNLTAKQCAKHTGC